MVCTFEEHSSVLAEWWSRKVLGETVIVLDAHLDLQFVNASRLRQLESCESVREFVDLAKPHPLYPDDGYCYSIEDFLYAAHRLGMIDRLIWVKPSHVSSGYSGAALRQLQETPGVTFDEITSFRRTEGGWLQGTLLGLSITICDIGHLSHLGLGSDCLLDIDIDYFVSVPGDRHWISPREVVEQLRPYVNDATQVTVSRSVETGYTPLSFRYIADFLAALWLQRDWETCHFERLFRMNSQPSDLVVASCREELESHPECAATWYQLSLAEADPAVADQAAAEAARACEAYRPSIVRTIGELNNRQLPIRLSDVLRIEKRLDREQSGVAAKLALAHASLGIVYCRLGQLSRAISHYDRAVDFYGKHPELAVEIGMLQFDQDADLAKSYFRHGLDDDKTRAAACACLGHAHRSLGELRQSLEYFERAMTIAPAWTTLLPTLVETYRLTGDLHRSSNRQAEYQKRLARLQQLETRLSSSPCS